ncbi:MAG: hypothetical protein CVV27_03800 [Candidatus Melainabacteria bacterium HGW-Melainabacteria-1]|nr:MAG: hypothetical protein CVV27_03800 [Candidatus Melainabacteria bacterium HGW-Melainabacteria-1]
MSDIERIRAAAAHPENWKPIKRSRPQARRTAHPLQSLMTSWPGVGAFEPLPRASAEALAETEKYRHGK